MKPVQKKILEFDDDGDQAQSPEDQVSALEIFIVFLLIQISVAVIQVQEMFDWYWQPYWKSTGEHVQRRNQNLEIQFVVLRLQLQSSL